MFKLLTSPPYPENSLAYKCYVSLMPASVFMVANLMLYGLNIRALALIVIFSFIIAGQLTKPGFPVQHVYNPQRINTNYILGFFSVFLAGIFPILAALSVETWHLGLFALVQMPIAIKISLTVLFLDAVFFLTHWGFHKAKTLRRFHLIHHSDPGFDVSLSGRDHPITAISLGVARGLCVLLLGIPLHLCVIYFFLVGAFTAFAHSNVTLPQSLEKKLAWLFVTPTMHYVHHSNIIRHANSNYGIIFSFWDRLAGTYTDPWQCDLKAIKTGVPKSKNKEHSNLKELFFRPFR